MSPRLTDRTSIFPDGRLRDSSSCLLSSDTRSTLFRQIDSLSVLFERVSIHYRFIRSSTGRKNLCSSGRTTLARSDLLRISRSISLSSDHDALSSSSMERFRISRQSLPSTVLFLSSRHSLVRTNHVVLSSLPPTDPSQSANTSLQPSRLVSVEQVNRCLLANDSESE